MGVMNVLSVICFYRFFEEFEKLTRFLLISYVNVTLGHGLFFE